MVTKGMGIQYLVLLKHRRAMVPPLGPLVTSVHGAILSACENPHQHQASLDVSESALLRVTCESPNFWNLAIKVRKIPKFH